MTPTGQWLADWMAEDGAVDRLPDGWDDPHALIAKAEAEARSAALGEVEEEVKDIDEIESGDPWVCRGHISPDDVLAVIQALRDSAA